MSDTEINGFIIFQPKLSPANTQEDNVQELKSCDKTILVSGGSTLGSA